MKQRQRQRQLRARGLLCALVLGLVSGGALVLRGAGNRGTGGASAPTGLRVLAIIPPSGFQEDEFFTSYMALHRAGVAVFVASQKAGLCEGANGARTTASLGFESVALADYDGIFLVGGLGVRSLLKDRLLPDLLRRAAKAGCVLGATSYAPVLLARAGLVKKVRVTSADDIAAVMEQAGARWHDKPVVADGMIVTGKGGRKHTSEFADQLVSQLAARVIDGATGATPKSSSSAVHATTGATPRYKSPKSSSGSTGTTPSDSKRRHSAGTAGNKEHDSDRDDD